MNTITEEDLKLIIEQAQARYMVALILLTGMVAILLSAFGFMFNLRKTGHFFLFTYGVLMSFIGVGFCYVIGPAIAFVALIGFGREWIGPNRATV